MQYVWQLQEAKNRFSEVVEEAIQHGPQTVTRHGREAVVIVSYDDYIKLKPEPTNLLKALQDRTSQMLMAINILIFV